MLRVLYRLKVSTDEPPEAVVNAVLMRLLVCALTEQIAGK